MVVPGGAKTFFHTDKMGSVIAMSDTSGALVEGPYTYDPYGRCFSGASLCSAGEPFRYTGQRLDPETGSYYYRARMYNPIIGRFLQIDPVGYAADLNLYTYVGNDPTDAVDPTGEICTVFLGNYGSSMCARSRYYEQLGGRRDVASRTTFFSAASYTTDALGSKDAYGGGALVSGSTSKFLDNMSSQLEAHNRGMLADVLKLPAGNIAANDNRLVTNEQNFVQGMLDKLSSSDPSGFKSIVGNINSILNTTATDMFNPTEAKALGEVRQTLGRDIDFSKKSDRIAIGQQLTHDIRATQVCTGSRIPGNCP